jgi:pimeloyl-ACP methyl ester carboxylesterase
MTTFHPKSATPPESRLVDIGDLSLRVTMHPGTGPDVLFVHGIASSGSEFDTVLGHVKDVMRPITVDLRGHGESDKPASGYHYRDYANDLDRLLDALGIEHPIIFGHSLGGILTLWWAIHHPNRAQALMLEDVPLRSGEEFAPAFDGWEQLNALPFEAARAYYREENPGWPDSLVETRARDITTTRREAITELRAASMANEGLDTLEGLERITVPVLFIHGDPETGSMVHPADLAALPDRLPSVRTVRIPGGGHSMHRNRVEEWVEIVKGFMRDLV